jgi:hypothetical protein
MNRKVTAAALLSMLVAAACQSGGRPEIGPSPHADGNGHAGARPAIMPLDELETIVREARQSGRTVRASGLSVFEGASIERFDAELLDIMKNFLPKRDLILARLLPTHPVVTKAGVIAGMSGSPVYLNGKVIGALAYSMGWFAKEPIIGITPIQYMIEDARRATPEIGLAPHRSPETGLAPIETPVIASGMPPAMVDRLAKHLKTRGLLLVPSGAGSRVHDVPDHFQPGSAIGAQLVSGDVDLTGVGTVTYVEDDLVIAFGHPFFGEGPTDLPITTAVVHTTFAGMMRSYKIASPVKEVGALTQDRATCIAGRVGKRARMIPVSIEFRNMAENLSQTMNVSIVNNSWFPMLVGMVSSYGVETFEPSQKPRTIVSKLNLKLSGGRSLQFEEVSAFNPEGLSAQAGDTMSALMRLMRNPYARLEIESLSVVNEYVNQARVAVVKAAWPLQHEVPEGGQAKIRVRLGKWRGPDELRDIEVPIPREVPRGSEVSIEIAGAPSVDPMQPPATTLDELIESLQKEYKATQLVATLYVDTLTVLYKGRTLERMPASVVAQLIPGVTDNAVLATTPVRVMVDAGMVIEGAANVTVRIK